jgi:hypothetical protein
MAEIQQRHEQRHNTQLEEFTPSSSSSSLPNDTEAAQEIDNWLINEFASLTEHLEGIPSCLDVSKSNHYLDSPGLPLAAAAVGVVSSESRIEDMNTVIRNAFRHELNNEVVLTCKTVILTLGITSCFSF